MANITELYNHSGVAWKECLDALEKEALAPTAPILGYRTTRLLPRKDFALYGECPKLETKVLVECTKCSMILLPSAFRNHCLNPNHGKNSTRLVVATSASTSSKSSSSSSKSSKPSNYIPPGASLLKKKYQQPKNKRKSGLPPPVPPPPLFAETSTPPPLPLLLPSVAELPGAVATTVTAAGSVTTTTTSTSHIADTKLTVDISILPTAKPPSPSAPPVTASSPAASHSSSKHRKSKKSSKKNKEETEKVHKTEKTSTETKLKLSTLLTPQKETSKPKEIPIVLIDYTLPSDGATKGDATTTSIISSTTIPSFLKISPAPQQHSTQKDISQPLQVAVAPTSTNKTQGSVESPSSVVYMPMSPVAVVNNVPVQLLQLPVLRVGTKQPMLSPPLAVSRPIVVTIPLQSSTTQMYTAHPKPLSMSSRGVRKIGTAFLLQNQRIDHQRNEVQSVASTRQTIANACNALNNFHHRPNILKNSARNNFKFGVKRPAADKLLNDSTKHIRLNDVNGFILHADVSESAEAPMHNNSVHDKVTFLNMK